MDAWNTEVLTALGQRALPGRCLELLDYMELENAEVDAPRLFHTKTWEHHEKS